MARRAEWLSQFAEADKPVAEKLLGGLMLVSHDDFATVICRLICNSFNNPADRVAIFAEREVKKGKGGVPVRLFKEKTVARAGGKRRRRRAMGAAPSAVFSSRGDRVEVGSEGLVASLNGQLSRKFRGVFFPNASPNLFRKKKIRHFVIVTDLIGSGDRAYAFLQAAWKVRSIRSWHSLGLLDFSVVAYAATEEGERRVRQHPSKPNVISAIECPTIKEQFFPDDDHGAVVDLCARYNRSTEYGALGYNETGALIVFHHGCPNNTPPIFHTTEKGWQPLFPRRVALDAEAFQPGFKRIDFAVALAALNYEGLEQRPSFQRLGDTGKKLVLLLCAISRGARKLETQCARTGLLPSEVEKLSAYAAGQKLVAPRSRLSDLGRGTLNSIVNDATVPPLSKGGRPYYYPQQLRLPV